MRLISYPTINRRIVSAAMMFNGFALTLGVKIVRGNQGMELPTWVMDSLPNFICAAVIPFAILMGNRAIRLLDFFSFCGLVAFGLVVYELFQLVMPNRTFETNDFIATALGALLPVALGWIFFQRNTEVE
jgi:hypothetical protein